MKLPRFYASLETTQSGLLHAVIRDGEYHHLRHVLRLKVGDNIEAVVQQTEQPASSFRCKLETILDTEAQAQILSEIPQPRLPAVSLVVGLVKPSRCDWIVEKAIELGVSRIIFFAGERTQGHRGKQDRRDRFMRVAHAATKQAGLPTTSNCPNITVSSSLKNALEELGDDTKICKILLLPENDLEKTSEQEKISGNTKHLVPTPSEPLASSEHLKPPSLKLILENTRENADFFLLIGPEGGFSAEERVIASHYGYLEATLGPRVLRTETAAVVAMGFVLSS